MVSGSSFWFSGPLWPLTEILKLREIPIDALETSWDALWLGIATLFGFNLDYRRLQDPLPKAEN